MLLHITKSNSFQSILQQLLIILNGKMNIKLNYYKFRSKVKRLLLIYMSPKRN